MSHDLHLVPIRKTKCAECGATVFYKVDRARIAYYRCGALDDETGEVCGVKFYRSKAASRRMIERYRQEKVSKNGEEKDPGQRGRDDRPDAGSDAGGGGFFGG